ncbi:MAG: SEC-C domain-containing protein, partial [Prevotella sp.]|nr:SEC-C domain-containing protein [Prevotella sp.]
VMNKQRTVVYSKRRHALMGERIGMDISNTIWDRVVNIIENNDYEGCKENFIKLFAMEVPFSNEEFVNKNHEDLAEEAFQTAMGNFKRKMERVQEVAMPVIKQVYENQGQLYERIVVPLTDGRKMYNIPCNLQEAYDTECKSVVKEFEKQILLHIIDEAWKENLRELDELKHSVQNASYEQKDPLLIFKLESVKLFDNMVNTMNNRSVSILMRAQIPEMQQVQEAAPEEHTQRQQYTESKQNLSQEQLTDPNQAAAAAQDTRAQQPRTPIIKDKMPGRNDPCPCGSGKKFKNCHGKGLV